MPAVVRNGDVNGGGGAAVGGVGSVLVNGQPIVVNGTTVTPHPPKKPKTHKTAKTAGGLGSVLAGGIAINVVGNSDTCGHTRANGSSNVIAG